MGSNTSKEKELLKIINELLDNDYKDRIVDDDIELISQYPEYEDYIRTIITVNNSEVLMAKKKELQEKVNIILSLQAPSKSSVLKEESSSLKESKRKDFSFYDLTCKKYEELVVLCYSEQDVIECLNNEDNDISTLALMLYKDINELISSIRVKLITNPTTDVSSEQEELKRLRTIFTAVKNYKKVTNGKSVELPNIILLIDRNGNSFVYNFINNNIDCLNKVKKNLEKFFKGEISNSKKLKGKEEGLLETTDINGARILYFDLGNNNYVLARVFIKDATRSIKIDGIYDKAIADFREQKNYILAHINNEEFKNRQFELINKLFRLLNNGDEVITNGRKI